MTDVVIVDTGLCNLRSITRAVEECGAQPRIAAAGSEVGAPSHVILPGVGAFPDAMENLERSGLVESLATQVRDHGVPFLGICLGMQLLAALGREVRDTRGLGWIDGDVTRLEPAPSERIPHVGWNQIELVGESPLFDGIEPGRDFYFVHSWALRPASAADVVATTPYGGGFASAVQRDNVFGVQFHPEKSQRAGFQVLRNFLAQ